MTDLTNNRVPQSDDDKFVEVMDVSFSVFKNNLLVSSVFLNTT